MDYRDIPREKWNKITVLRMAEHVGIRKFQKFMRQLNGMLEEDGILFLQIAGLRRNWTAEDFTWGMFMSKYVFPGADASMPLSFVCNNLERAGFENPQRGEHRHSLLAHPRRWYRNWLKNRDTVVQSYGERWFRLWEIFLAWSVVVSERGGSTAFQLVCNKNKSSVRPQALDRRARPAGQSPEELTDVSAPAEASPWPRASLRAMDDLRPASRLDIAAAAALLSEPARVSIVSALMDGRRGRPPSSPASPGSRPPPGASTWRS
jgi:hypothetical protein